MAGRSCHAADDRVSAHAAAEVGQLPWDDSAPPPDVAERSLELSGRSEAFGLTISDPLELAAGTDLGGVTILRLLDAGGMGRVYEARQSSPERLVAVKVLRDAIATPDQVRRFAYEAAVLGRLRHPNIAAVHVSGTFRHGTLTLPFFVMELVPDARPITHYAREHGLGLTARIELFHRVCDAVAHGHRKGVIHRDLKPANILVDATGDPKVIDYGVARATGDDTARAALRTAAGQLVGTLLYMSPEQLDGRVDEIDARTDVYALGLVLHELVVGRLPHERASPSLLEAVRATQEASCRASRAVERAAVDAGCGRFAARSLAAIVGSCLAPDPTDRYATGVEVAAEIARWTAGEPILARPPAALEVLGRLARRHRAATVAAGVTAAAVVAAVAGISVFSVDAARQAAAARSELYAASVLLAAESRDRDALPEARRRLAAARGLAADSGSRQPVELDWLAASLDDAIAASPVQPAAVQATAWSPDGTRVALGMSDGRVRIVPAPGRGRPDEQAVELQGHAREVWRTAWSRDGMRVATASEDKTARVWDAAIGRELLRIDAHAAKVYGVAFSHDGALFATSGADKTARLWDASTGEERGVLAGHAGTVYSVEFLADDRTVVTASQDKKVKVWDVANRTVVNTLEGHDDWVFHAVPSADGKRLATAGRDGTARLWRITEQKPYATLEHPFRVNSVAFTADSRHVVTASHDGVLRIFTSSRGREVRRFRGHDDKLWSVSCAADGPWVATGSQDRTVRVWATDADGEPVIRLSDGVRAAAFSPRGDLIAVGGEGSTVTLWDSRTLASRGRLKAAAGWIRDIAFREHGALVAAACDDGTVRTWGTDCTGPEVPIPCHGRAIYSVAFTADDTLMVTASDDNTASIRALAGRDAALHVLAHPKRCYCARFSPDARLVYTACEDGIVRAWSVASGRQMTDFAVHGGAVNWVAVSPDGGRLATASSDGTVGIWSAADQRLVHRLTGPARQVWKVAFSPDGSRVAAVSGAGTLHLWDSATGRRLPDLHGHGDEAWTVVFAPDGRTIASGGLDRTVRVWGCSPAALFRSRVAVSSSPR